MAVANETIFAGVGVAEVGKAFGALAQNFSAFNPQAEEANKAMVKNVALLEQASDYCSETRGCSNQHHERQEAQLQGRFADRSQAIASPTQFFDPPSTTRRKPSWDATTPRSRQT